MSTDRLGNARRFEQIYASGVIAVFVLIAGAKGAWVPAVAVAALGLGLVVFPAQRRAIVLTALAAAVVAAALVLGPRLLP